MKSLALLALLVATCPKAEAEPRDAEPEVALLADIAFAQGSARLPEASGTQLVRVAAWAFDHHDGLVVIDGHADATGRAADSVRLSLKRARLVRDQLVALGVDPSQIVVTAFGSEGRRNARVAVWGTRAPMIAKGRVPQPRHARPSPARRR